ncbi:MAG: hypothetical protein VKJ06_08915 [Vampirovibrionales bacterium]|nr:hypothetical protein [Vampirovibrionales bacterium]
MFQPSPPFAPTSKPIIDELLLEWQHCNQALLQIASADDFLDAAPALWQKRETVLQSLRALMTQAVNLEAEATLALYQNSLLALQAQEPDVQKHLAMLKQQLANQCGKLTQNRAALSHYAP